MAWTELNPVFLLLAPFNLLLSLSCTWLLARRGRQAWPWLLLGLAGGFLWPLAALLVLAERPPPPTDAGA